MNNDLYIEKLNFVKGPLTECLRAANCGVMALSYALRSDNKEIVTIHFDCECGCRRYVNVSGDSHLAIIQDVLKKI